MKITYDPAKRERVKQERGLDFEDARTVFAGAHFTVPSNRPHSLETRFQTVGYLLGRMVMVVWTPRGDARHIIPMRKCNAKECQRYQVLFA